MSVNAKQQMQEQNRLVRAEIARHPVDCGQVQISVSGGTIYLYGKVRPLRTHEGDFQQALDTLMKALYKIHGIREVTTFWQVLAS